MPVGEKCSWSKLSQQKIEMGKLLRANGWQYWRIAERFNVHVMTIHSALTGKSWRHA
jgi:hypothetical protein